MTASTTLIRGVAAGLTALSLGALATAAHAQADVTFTHPEKFSDIGDMSRDRDTAMKQLQQHLETLAARELPGKQLKVEFTDVDLAGEIEPKASIQQFRVLRTITIPRLEFNYVLSENGKTLKSGKADLKDMNYQSGSNRYFSSEPLRFEKKMIDDWMAKDLLGKERIARANP